MVVKDQAGLEPIKQWELVLRFDPEAVNANTHGDAKTFKKRGGFLSVGCPVPRKQTKALWLTCPSKKAVEVFGIPGAENVRLVAKGYLGEDHYGIKNQTVKGLSNDFHVRDVEPERFARGETRFQRWHIDAPLFIRDPAWFTTLRAIKLPEGPDVTINWDDGSGYSKTSKPGLTAFFSGTQLYSLLTDEEKRLADHSWVEYAPYPYQWIENCKGNTTGLGLVTQGKEHTIEELGEWDPKLVKRVSASTSEYFLAWVTTEQAADQASPVSFRLAQPIDWGKGLPGSRYLRSEAFSPLWPGRGAPCRRRPRRDPRVPARHSVSRSEARVHLPA